MVYTKILFNNIKEYTPKFMKTIPFSRTVLPKFGRKKTIAWKMN